MLRVFYQDGVVDTHEDGTGLATKPKEARKWAVALVTGVTANNDIYKTEFWSIDENCVESCETFFNRNVFKL